jgi:hypothetical protein
MPAINNTKEFKQALRNGPYAWPGGYPIYFITSDGAVLSYKAAKQEAKMIISAIRDNRHEGWLVIGSDINYEDQDLICDHTGTQIECAYSD